MAELFLSVLGEWGSDAPAKVGQFMARLVRFTDRIENDDDFVAWMDWFDRLPARDMKAITRALAG